MKNQIYVVTEIVENTPYVNMYRIRKNALKHIDILVSEYAEGCGDEKKKERQMRKEILKNSGYSDGDGYGIFFVVKNIWEDAN